MAKAKEHKTMMRIISVFNFIQKENNVQHF